MAKTHRIEGDLELLGIAYMGKDQSTGTTRTIQLRGAEANISLILTPKGTGTIQVPASYEDNIASDQDIINRAYAHARVAGITAGALVTSPGEAQNGYAITYDHATTSYTLSAVASGLTFSNGLAKSANNVKLGGTDILDAETNITQNAVGVTRLRTMYTTGSDEAGIAVEAVAQDNNQVTLYAVGGSIKITPTEAIVTAPGIGALKYFADYSEDYTTRSLPDVAWVQSHIGGKNVNTNITEPGASEHGYVIGWENGTSTYKLIPFPAPSSGYTTVEDEGVDVTTRTTINFVGAGVSVSDSGGKTVVTINGGITNSAAANELMKSDGNNAIASGLISVSDGSIRLGASTTAGDVRNLGVDGLSDNIALNIFSLGTHPIFFNGNPGAGPVVIGTYGSATPLAEGQLFVTKYSESNPDTTLNALTLIRRSGENPVNGIGVGIDFQIQTIGSATTQKSGAFIQVIATDVTNGSEDFDLVFKTMSGGTVASEVLRLNELGASITDVAAYHLGDPSTDGTWRFIRSGDDLLIQQRESGAYVTKSTIAGT